MTTDPSAAMYATDGTSHFDVLDITARTVVLRRRHPDYAATPVRDERFDTGAHGSGVMMYPTLADTSAPVKRLRLRKDGTYRVADWCPSLRFTNDEPTHSVDNRL